jgi:hypothetical protein
VVFRCFLHFQQQVTCQFFGLFDSAVASILHSNMGGGFCE